MLSLQKILVFDIGGTYFRYAVVENERILESGKFSSPGFMSRTGKTGDELAEELLISILDIVKNMKSRFTDIYSMAVAMPGIVTGEGIVVSAPPLWGTRVSNIPLREILYSRTGMRVHVFNDLCGTAFYYAGLPEFAGGAEYLTLITLSTGIGSKTVDMKTNKLIMDSSGRAGEIGHIVVDDSAHALPCDCGGRGHLSSYLSGRGIVRLIRRMAGSQGIGGSSGWIDLSSDDEHIVKMFSNALNAGDSFAMDVLDSGVGKLVKIIRCMTTAYGVDRYIIVGGLASALGKHLICSIQKHLIGEGIFGWEGKDLDGLVKLGYDDDTASLLGSAQIALLAG